MTVDEQVRAATMRFYDALNTLFSTGDTTPMRDTWHHTPEVSSSHPFGPWLHGWDEVWATWVECSALANPDSKGASIQDMKVRIYGDVAYITGVFVTAPSLGSIHINVTDILHCAGGEWKIVHHHADKTPSLETQLGEAAL